ncbi:MAG: DnaJ domain-containing protein [Oscillospiraceae bacterium]|nr:DnaJ domain-containing protein [Oscillospiraceae bacterium]
MTDPYEVLNIPNTATDEEVKKAYRNLARKYHPDNYHDNPLADLAQEKMKEVNAAYDAIQKERSGRSAASSGYAQQQSRYGGYQQRSGAAGGAVFQQIRMAINCNDLQLAEQLLAQVGERNGEWHYLKGTVCYRHGWIDEARRYYQTACQLDPGNPEFQQALHFVENGRGAYRPEGYEVFSTGCGSRNLCGRMACTYLLCNLCSCCGVRFLYC